MILAMIRMIRTAIFNAWPSETVNEGSQLPSLIMTMRENTMTRTIRTTPKSSPENYFVQSAKRIIFCLWPSVLWRSSMDPSRLTEGKKSMLFLCSSILPILLQRMYQMATTRILNSIEKGYSQGATPNMFSAFSPVLHRALVSITQIMLFVMLVLPFVIQGANT